MVCGGGVWCTAVCGARWWFVMYGGGVWCTVVVYGDGGGCV